MTDQTKIRNFSIIAHLDRVAPSSYPSPPPVGEKLTIPLGLLSPQSPAALRLCGGPILILSARFRRASSEMRWVDLPDGRCA